MTDERTQQAQQTRTTQATAVPRTVAGRYTLQDELGRGGMGIVWRAQDTVIGRPVAIKELRLPDGAEDVGAFQERVLREVRTGGRLNDPAVVTVFDVVTEGDATFIVMELVEAPTLSDVVRQGGGLPPHQVASIGGQVLAALQAAHEAGIVHRDVKPGNIMVAANGRVKLTDFGIAQAVDDPRLTTSGMLVGSPAFMAPERVAGQPAVPASDLWSLGVTLYFAVEGLLPFERDTTAATLHAIMHEVPYLTHVQGPLASAIMGMLISSPDARITAQQAQHLLGMAAQQVAGAPSTPPGGQTRLYGAQPPTMLGQAPARPGNTAKRTALRAAGAVAAVGLLVGGFFLGKPVWSPATDEAMLPTMTYGGGGDIAELDTSSRTDTCLNSPLAYGRGISSTNWISCDDTHFVEIYRAEPTFGEYTSNDDSVAGYPGVEHLTRFAEGVCAMEFYSDAIPAEQRPELRYRALVPTQQAWEAEPGEDSGEERVRDVYCALSYADENRSWDSELSQDVQ